jgi:hypothetical protein
MFCFMALVAPSRIMALAMLLLAPGIAGSAVQWLHACPAQEQAAADHRQHNSDSPQSGHEQGCQCIGSCNTANVVAPAKSLALLAVLLQPAHPVLVRVIHGFVPAGTPSHLLPPATAPPPV